MGGVLLNLDKDNKQSPIRQKNDPQNHTLCNKKNAKKNTPKTPRKLFRKLLQKSLRKSLRKLLQKLSKNGLRNEFGNCPKNCPGNYLRKHSKSTPGQRQNPQRNVAEFAEKNT